MAKGGKYIFALAFLSLLICGCKPAEKAVSARQGAGAQTIAPIEFELPDLSGGTVSLRDYRQKKAVVLVFWTTWCPYCRIALKSLKEDSPLLSAAGVELLAINVGESALRAGRFIRSLGLDFKVLLDQSSKVADSYDIMGVPSYFIVNKSGEVVFSGNTFPKERLKELTAK